jgi:GNAT superfamily N-acetyltransferase
MHIELLADHPTLVDVIARWHYDEWSQYRPGRTYEDWADRIAKRVRRDGIPTTFVAFDEGEPVGTSMLVEHDMETRLDLTPWLAGVYVRPEHRGRGAGSALVKHATQRAGEFGVRTLYLHTEASGAARRIYTRLGWEVIATEPYHGLDVVIMATGLADQ